MNNRLLETSPVAETVPVETEVKPPIEVILVPNETAEEPIVTALFANAAFGMFVNVLEEPLIVLFVSVCVPVNNTTFVDKALSETDWEGKLTVPLDTVRPLFAVKSLETVKF